ncbi:MAG: PIG-L family deacetylase [Anaerolineae bacterium]|nr:PIG-L family deacetylase [Anaerolineae bacterium]
MKILYIFPHPDDESFGVAHAMSKQRRQGHEVYLLTLTKGGATRQRFKHGYSVEEMGEVRYQEMRDVAQVLDLTDMTVLDLPDSGLKEMDPRDIERVIVEHIERMQPNVVVTYAVHGISGFYDHLVTHAVVKRAYVELAERAPYLKRLAFYTLTEEDAGHGTHFKLSGSKPGEIDCVFEVEPVDVEKAHQALDCYVTFQETIENTKIKEFVHPQVMFEIYRESHDPPLDDLFAGLA